jgi:hypothetical protein
MSQFCIYGGNAVKVLAGGGEEEEDPQKWF